MKRAAFLLLFSMAVTVAMANDGVFFAQGNHLIPITETDISVKKEILTLNRVGNHIEVTVYYEFYNPVGEKDLVVGFEAESPSMVSESDMKYFPYHPNIRNFKVVVNDEKLDYRVAHVSYSYFEGERTPYPEYYRNGDFQSWTRKQCEDTLVGNDEFPFEYVYHFRAHFNKGLNIVEHTYDFDMSNTVLFEYYFPYVLTAANRWANHQIDDFTLNINMGERESFTIQPSFFKSAKEWTIAGIGTVADVRPWGEDESARWPQFHMRKGGVTFHKEDFRPEAELFICKKSTWMMLWFDDPDEDMTGTVLETFREQYCEIDTFLVEDRLKGMKISDEAKRILYNLPFAYRGYVFKTKSLQEYFDSCPWYRPDLSYTPDLNSLTEDERLWMRCWK